MNYKKNLIVILFFMCITNLAWSQGFASSVTDWNVPGIGNQDYRFLHQYARHHIMDINGDNLPDFIYSEDPANSSSTWVNGAQKYWKVYLNTGAGFSATATNWNVPGIGNQDYRFFHQYARHYIMDINGDNLPDFIYSEDPANSGNTWVNGAQKYWKVYLNTGSGFSATATDWNVPGIGNQDYRFLHQYARHHIMDINGDNLPDFIYSEDPANSSSTWVNGAQKYWKVYLNTGTGFASSATNWNVPGIGNQDYRFFHQYARHHIMDINGDNLPDFIYSEDPANSSSTWVNGAQKYWKVYLNTGAGFASSATNWNVPGIGNQDYRFFHQYARHHVMDINGDNLPDFIYSEDPANSSSTWVNGAQKYWKAYMNTGAGFAAVATDWNVPGIGNQDYRFFHQYARHYVMDMNGDNLPDFIYSEDPANSSSTWLNGAQKYWKVYLNTTPISTSTQKIQALNLKTWPNPTNNLVYIDASGLQSPNIKLFNTLGILVHEEQGASNDVLNIDLSSYASGVYYLTISNGNQIFETKIIKE